MQVQIKNCENCNGVIAEKYGSGRFCSQKCARGFSSKEKRKEINEKVSKKLIGKILFGNFVCEKCGKQFEKNTSLRSHLSHCSKKRIYSFKNATESLRQFYKKRKIQHAELILSGADFSETRNSKIKRKLGQKFKHFLFATNLKEKKCEKCGLEKIWNGEKIVLQLHHIDNNPINNVLNNVMILCPNCHSQTEHFGFRGRTHKNSLQYSNE